MPTSSPLIILSPRESDAATMVASSEISSALAVTNLQTMQPGKKWRSSSNAAQYITFDFGASSTLAPNAAAIVCHNFTATTKVRYRFAASAAAVTAAPVVDTGTVDAWIGGVIPTAPLWPSFTSLITWSNNTALRYGRVDISDAGGTLSYFQAGRLVVGRYWQPSINFDIGGTPLLFNTMDVQKRTPYGRLFTDQRATSPARAFELSIYALTKREAFDGIYELQRLRGAWGDVVCCLDPSETTDAHRFVMQGVFSKAGAYTLPPSFDSSGNMFGAGISLEEVIP